MSMSKRRPLLPDQFRDERLLPLPVHTRLTAIGLRLYADDEGRELATPLMIKSALWPLDRDVTEEHVEEHLLQLDEVGYLQLYALQARTFFAITDWPRVDGPVPSRFPAPPPSESNPDPLRVEEERERAERESGSASGSARAESPSAPDPDTGLPSPFCPAHPVGTFAPCRNCGTARLRHEKAAREALRMPSAGPTFSD